MCGTAVLQPQDGVLSSKLELVALGPLLGMTLPRVFGAVLCGLSEMSTVVHMSLPLSGGGGGPTVGNGAWEELSALLELTTCCPG